MSTYPLPNKTGVHYLGNSSPSKKEVHDLHNQKTACQISEIVAPVGFVPDTLDEAHQCGYDNCEHCIGNSKR